MVICSNVAIANLLLPVVLLDDDMVPCAEKYILYGIFFCSRIEAFTKDYIQGTAGQYTTAVVGREDLDVSADLIKIDTALADAILDGFIFSQRNELKTFVKAQVIQ